MTYAFFSDNHVDVDNSHIVGFDSLGLHLIVILVETILEAFYFFLKQHPSLIVQR